MIGESIEIKLPDFSEFSDKNTIISKLYIKVGDKIRIGDVFVEVEVGIVNLELESYVEGEVLHVATLENADLKTDDLICIIGEAKVEKSTVEKPTPKVNKKLDSDLEIITMPRMSNKMTHGKINKWKFKLGDFVNKGDILLEIDIDKATMDLEAYQSGTLLYVGAKMDESMEIGNVIAVILKKGKDFKHLFEEHERVAKYFDSKNTSLLKENTKTRNNKGFLSQLWDFLTP